MDLLPIAAMSEMQVVDTNFFLPSDLNKAIQKHMSA